jgi:hypothetical protein
MINCSNYLIVTWLLPIVRHSCIFSLPNLNHIDSIYYVHNLDILCPKSGQLHRDIKRSSTYRDFAKTHANSDTAGLLAFMMRLFWDIIF